jgi:hypothetical protein
MASGERVVTILPLLILLIDISVRQPHNPTVISISLVQRRMEKKKMMVQNVCVLSAGTQLLGFTTALLPVKPVKLFSSAPFREI